MDKIYKKVGNEVYVIPVAGNPPSHQFLKEEKPIIPHYEEKIDANNLGKFQKMKSFLKNKLSANNL